MREPLTSVNGSSSSHGALRLLPTPQAHDTAGAKTPEQIKAMKARGRAAGHAPGVSNLNEAVLLLLDADGKPNWGRYEAAVHRWEFTSRYPAPGPVELGPSGKNRLSPSFSEWMMGLVPGWVTGVPRLSRSQQLRILGNGVVPQQAVRALQSLLREC